MASTSYQSIADFYTDKSIFITGGTGFLGKTFIEKLLYSCSKLDKIYLLMRQKKGVDINARHKNLFDNPLFIRLKERSPESFNKVVPIYGDIALPRLGMNQEDEDTLIKKVSVVIHSAATVKLNEPLSIAMNINFEGTQRVLNLCKRMNNIQAFVYVSTAYAHCQLPVISEMIYPAPAKLEDVYNFIENNDNNRNETEKFIRHKPNSYTFSKAMAESYVAENHENIPTVIIRPSIVSSTINEPVKGWLDNWFGATRVIFNTGKGWNHVNLGTMNCLVDLIPVDYVCNLTIVAATKAQESNVVQVFNCASSCENPLTWGEFHRYAVEEYIKKGYNDVPFLTSIYYFKSREMVDLFTMILQILPAYILDCWLRAAGTPAKYEELISRVVRLRNSVEYFTSHSWVIEAERTRKLFSTLSPEDQMIFPCDPVNIRWAEYIIDYVNGIYQYLILSSLDGTPAGHTLSNNTHQSCRLYKPSANHVFRSKI